MLEKTVTKLSKDLKDNKEAQNYLHQKIVVKFLRGYYIEGNRHAPSLEIKKRA